MKCGELVSEFIHYGISSISLATTGSKREGIRACTSRMTDELYDVLDTRLKLFIKDR